MDDTTRTLTQYVMATTWAGLPAAALHEGKRRLIDSVACAAAAYPETFCQTLRRFAQRSSGTPAARLWGSGVPTSLEMAAFTNGTMVRYLDYSDTFLAQSAGHPSDMIAALVALAEAYRRDGKALLTAMVVAYEVYCGLCVAWPLQTRGIDQATCAVVGTAAGAGQLLGLDEAQQANALALALAPNLHLYNVRTGALSDWKGCAGPNGARNGVFAALLAAEGVTGPTAVVTGKGGLQDVLGAPLDWQVGRGARPLIMDTHLKSHPVCYHGQSGIDAAIALRAAVPIERIKAVVIETYEASYRIMGSDRGKWAPDTRETADHSLPYTIAVTLTNGRLTAADYADQRLSDPALLRLMDKISVKVDAGLSATYPDRAQTRVTIHDVDGGVFVHLQEQPRGHALNPLTDAELDDKFLQLCGAWTDAAGARALLALLWDVDQLADVTTLVDALCVAR